ncbi:unnamed protein product [Notodromas monacha]|uniref:RZ-type domain-containing protein n=1 Tax=Notodromas monacha TaxID=399045 RepID=A0A7R9BG65_9CRUS|nr:unnamed protein product [Notodromas monacha]CAG0913264.1 unnamed protein product [Notodromas monacha]
MSKEKGETNPSRITAKARPTMILLGEGSQVGLPSGSPSSNSGLQIQGSKEVASHGKKLRHSQGVPRSSQGKNMPSLATAAAASPSEKKPGSGDSTDRGGRRRRGCQGSGGQNKKPHDSDPNFKSQASRGMPEKENPAMNAKKRERDHPMSLKDLQQLCEGQDPAPIFAVVNEMSGFPLALRDERLKDHPERIRCILKVLCKALTLQGFGLTIGNAISLALHSKFLHSLLQFNLTTLPSMCRSKPKDARDILCTEVVLFDVIIRLCPADEAMNVEACVNSVRMIVLDLDDKLGADEALTLTMKRVRENLADLRRSVQMPDHAIDRKVAVHGRSHLEEAPDDFRTSPVLPSLEDLLGKEEPFLRANITSGRYLNVDHYLDVQFRLMKEDFVRPLREGVAEILKRIQSNGCNFAAFRNIQDVRIYEKGVITGKFFDRIGVTLDLKFSLKNLSRVRWEISKRLIFGSLLCLTNDNFKTVMFASVVERDVEKLKRGIIRILPESDQFDLKAWTNVPEFLVVESAAFFEAYRHVLSSLQSIRLDRYPMKKYIVDLTKETSVPRYVLDHFGEKSGVFPLTHNGKELVGDPFSDQWPEPESLGLDEGVKLRPILVVCFTNHALDQFLEGISAFTKKILRIGGRSKSILLEPFTVRTVRMNSKGNAFQVSRDIGHRMRDLERFLGELEVLRKGISSGTGVLTVEVLRRFGIDIPPCFSSDFSLANWLGFNRDSENVSQKFLNQILEEEKNLLPAGVEIVNDDDEDVEEGKISEIDPVDFDLEDEAAAEMQRREVESINDADRKVKGLNKEQANECMRLHCEISAGELKIAIKKAEEGLKEAKKKVPKPKKNAQTEETFTPIPPLEVVQELREWNSQLEDLKMKKAALEAYSAFLKLPSNLGLTKPPEASVGHENNWLNLRVRGRWLLYRYWANEFVRILGEKIIAKMEEYKTMVESYKEAQDGALLQHTRSLDVVGMTTTGAARNILVVQNMNAKVLVIEEAAEVLESHVVCCLSTHCEHLIQIGDQQQLRPSTTVYKLAKNYGLDVSLFERMVKNGVPYERLRQQHRMRPEISNLIKQNIYEDLQDHESVTLYDDVLGVDKNVFFVTHHSTEDSNEDLKSKSNVVEAEFLLALCRYLLLQGYTHEQITILTGYSGQLFIFKKLISGYPMCAKVRITLVDNYQGEENDIILLSLVRSNVEGNIGFLKTDNRVNVALSRAKQGLFIVGNLDVLSSASQLWRNIKNVLSKENQIGKALLLRCQNHPDQLASVFKPSEFPVSGGCNKICNGLIDACGHLCERLCHVVDKHHTTKEYSCRRPCERRCPEIEGHQCRSVCGKMPCPPCKEIVHRELVPCGHWQYVKCFENLAEVKCETGCFARLECGHACEGYCHVTNDPDHLLFKCLKPCGMTCPRDHPCKAQCCQSPCPECRELVDLTLTCGHVIKAHCYLRPDQVQCRAKCARTLPCGHHCLKNCNESCGNCFVKVKKIIPDCSHSVTVHCCKVPENADCQKQCEKLLPCGHRCAEKCSRDCTTSCGVLMNVGKIGKCGHQLRLPCHIIASGQIVSVEDGLEYCDHPCGALLACGHTCVGKCSDCLQGRIHMPCEEPCGRQLVCGHVCKVACSFNCPPCKEPCENSCPHSACSKLCGEPCSPCLEKCESGCAHKPCKLKCSQDCGRGDEKCDEPCEKDLPCEHKCVGICGEICPPCRKCSGDEVEFFDCIMNDVSNEPDERFLVLPKCGHVIEVAGLDQWMRMPLDIIGPRVCPRCKTPIFSSRRYKDEVNAALKNVIAVKERIFGKNDDIKKILEKLIDKADTSSGKMIQEAFSREKIFDRIHDEIVYHTVKDPTRKKPPVRKFRRLDAMKLNSISNRFDLLKTLAALILKCQRDASLLPTFKKGFDLKLRKFAELVMAKKDHLNDSTLKAISAEFQRLRYFPLLELMLQNYPSSELVSQVKAILYDIGCFTDDKEAEMKRLLKDAEHFVVEMNLEEERLTLNAIRCQGGSWNTCSNGHAYIIGDCGAPNQSSRCPDCREGIGGRGTALRMREPPTSITGVVSTWSQSFNNMTNFNANDTE